MLYWALIFQILALIAGIIALSGIAGAASIFAWIFFIVFVALFVFALRRGRGAA